VKFLSRSVPAILPQTPCGVSRQPSYEHEIRRKTGL
jgi:hypothetical protein